MCLFIECSFETSVYALLAKIPDGTGSTSIEINNTVEIRNYGYVLQVWQLTAGNVEVLVALVM